MSSQSELVPKVEVAPSEKSTIDRMGEAAEAPVLADGPIIDYETSVTYAQGTMTEFST